MVERQTRWVQGPVSEGTCGFKSHLPHSRENPDGMRKSGFISWSGKTWMQESSSGEQDPDPYLSKAVMREHGYFIRIVSVPYYF